MAETLGYKTVAVDNTAELETKLAWEYLERGHLAPSADFQSSQNQVSFYWGIYEAKYFKLQVLIQIFIRSF